MWPFKKRVPTRFNLVGPRFYWKQVHRCEISGCSKYVCEEYGLSVLVKPSLPNEISPWNNLIEESMSRHLMGVYISKRTLEPWVPKRGYTGWLHGELLPGPDDLRSLHDVLLTPNWSWVSLNGCSGSCG